MFLCCGSFEFPLHCASTRSFHVQRDVLLEKLVLQEVVPVLARHRLNCSGQQLAELHIVDSASLLEMEIKSAELRLPRSGRLQPNTKRKSVRRKELKNDDNNNSTSSGYNFFLQHPPTPTMLETPNNQSLSMRTHHIKKNRKPLETAAKPCASRIRLDLISMLVRT